MHHQVLLVLSLLFAIGLLHMLSSKLRVSFPILLVLGGLAISLIPGLPEVRLDPELVFLVFLPPLLYEAAWYTSWHDFWRLKRPILIQAFGLVFFTSSVVAWVAHLAGFPWAVGFLLGGIISPPDAVAATSVLKGLPVPKRAVAILEGESLINDASSLIVFRFALATVLTGSFDAGDAALQLVILSLGGVAVGLLLARLVFWIHQQVPNSGSIDVALTVMTPYLIYLLAEQVHTSGVLAVVAGGLYLSYRSHEFLQPRSRVQATAVWWTLVFLLNGLVFILIGLQLPLVVRSLGVISLQRAIGYGVAISALVIVVRLGWTFVAAYIMRLSPARRRTSAPPNPRFVFLIGWSGMRGVVSLASALSVPLLAHDAPFPERELLLFVTFVVILCTLVLQGLSLPPLVRWLRFPAHAEEGADQLELLLARATSKHLRERYPSETSSVPAFARLLEHYEQVGQGDFGAGHGAYGEDEASQRYREALRTITIAQRAEILRIRREGTIGYELTQLREDKLDLEAARLEAKLR